jgi:hypothetical protein
MIEHAVDRADFCDVEEMVRAAGDYMEVSEDLRPRTLEEARDRSHETSTRTWTAAMAIVIVFLAMCAGQFRDRIATKSPLKSLVSANGTELYVAARQANVDPSWSLVEAFRGLRQRQAGVIEDAFF